MKNSDSDEKKKESKTIAKEESEEQKAAKAAGKVAAKAAKAEKIRAEKAEKDFKKAKKTEKVTFSQWFGEQFRAGKLRVGQEREILAFFIEKNLTNEEERTKYDECLKKY